MAGLAWLDATRLPVAAAAVTLEAALRSGLDPEADAPRAHVEAPAGLLMMMPASGDRYAGVKLVTVAPDNPGRDLPLVQGVYVLFHGGTLAPLAALDGAELTSLRTPAVSTVAVRHLTPDRPLSTVVFGTGAQAWGHVQACAVVRRLARLAVVGRDRGRAEAFAARCRAVGVPAATGTADAVRDADLVLCCTTSPSPVFDGALVPDTAAVVAVGAYQPHTREVDEAYVRRAALYVEARRAALREAGEVAGVPPERLVNLAELLGATVDLERPRLFKSVGQAWEDLVVAAAVYEAAR